MTGFKFALLSLLAFVAAPAAAVLARKKCDRIKTPSDFDIDKYIEKSWYVQRQQTNSYQPTEDLFCVVATYEDEGRRQWGRKAITVYNRAQEGLNNDNGANTDFGLCATRRYRLFKPAQLRVSPCFLPPGMGGDYWVVAFAEDYSWAIITGGQPKIPGQCEDDGLCTLRDECPLSFLPCLGNGQGLWFFTREQLPEDSVLEEMEAKALELGICTANMLPVTQEGCTYEGYRIKA